MTDLTLQLAPEQAQHRDALLSEIAKTLNVEASSISHFSIVRKSIDARRGNVVVNLKVQVYFGDEPVQDELPQINYRNVHGCEPVVVVGAGPAGLFAALRLLELGLKPIIIERGRAVADRKRDIALLNRNLNLNTESNYAYGEGGAGAFSDGKLYTRSKKRGDNQKILHTLCRHGANASILYEAHPHIGSDKLPSIIEEIRATIVQHGGEFMFGARVESLVTDAGAVQGVVLADGQKVASRAVILATGHSAKDMYRALHEQGVKLEIKPFALGVRVEHPQELINDIQYHGAKQSSLLPAATYSLVEQIDGRGVYSFCMCPGGFIVPAATSPREVVVNGMSASQRNSPYANAGIVVEIAIDDMAQFAKYGDLAGLEFQQQVESLAYKHGGSGVIAPAQRLTDFVGGKHSSSLPECSYNPGLMSSDLHTWLPKGVAERLQKGFRRFDRKMNGFLTSQAVVLGVESRTSSPVRIPRHPQTLQHIALAGLFPAGEGAGYAGGIVSSALDGDRCAMAVHQFISA